MSPAPDRPLVGILLRVAGATSFAVMSVALKLASEHGVTAPEMIFYRNFFALPIVLGWALAGPGIGALRTSRPLAHLTRSGIGLVSMLFTFEALVLLPLAEATTITFSAPIFATLLSALMLRESIGRYRWAAVLVGFIGIVVIARPGETSGVVPLVGITVALAAALGQALVAITLRQIGKTEQIAAIVFWFTVITSLAGAAMLPFFGKAHDNTAWLLLLLGGATGGAAQILMTASLRHAAVSAVVPFDYMQMLWAILFGWLVWSMAPSHSTIAGALLVACAGIATAWREHRRRAGAPATQLMAE